MKTNSKLSVTIECNEEKTYSTSNSANPTPQCPPFNNQPINPDTNSMFKTEKSKAKAVGGALLKIARGSGADLLLMGAFGQSRRRELVMGGVTQHIIDHADLPVLLTH